MDIQKPIRMLEGIGKMVKDDQWKTKANSMKTYIYMTWPRLTEKQQEEVYDKACKMFLLLTDEIMNKIGKA